MINIYEWKPIPVYLKYFDGVKQNTYYCNMAGQIAKINQDNTFQIIKQINSPTRASVNLSKFDNTQKQINVKTAIMLTFSYRDDYYNHSIININKNLYDNNINNLMWDDYTRFGNKIMMLPIPPIPTLPDEVWTKVTSIGYMSDVDTSMLFCSTFGRLYTDKRKPMILNPEISNGYYRVTLDGFSNNPEKRKIIHKLVHRIILNTFKYNENYAELQVNHIDGNKLNNNINNLEWCTPLENTQHSRYAGLNLAYGENHPLSKYTKEQVWYVLDSYLNKKSLNTIFNDNDFNKSFISDIIIANLRVNEITEYMILHGFVPSKLFTHEQLIEIIKECNNNCNGQRNFRSVYKKFNIKRNTPEYLSIGIIYFLIYNCITWISYIEL